jgi:hypothetical protein
MKSGKGKNLLIANHLDQSISLKIYVANQQQLLDCVVTGFCQLQHQMLSHICKKALQRLDPNVQSLLDRRVHEFTRTPKNKMMKKRSHYLVFDFLLCMDRRMREAALLGG